MMSLRSVLDARGTRVSIDVEPRRIVSLVPSTTETLHDLGLGASVVGRTRFCVRPVGDVDRIAVVGGTKAVRMAELAALEPSLILANEEENKPTMWPELEAVAPLYVAFPRTVAGALDDLTNVATLTGTAERGAEIRAEIEATRARHARRAASWSYAYMIWRDPWMTVDDDTFIASMLAEYGGKNVFGGRAERYPSVTLDDLTEASPDVVFFSSEPYDFEPAHAADLGPLADRMRMIDGEAVSWHGTRMLRAFEQLGRAQPTWGVSR